MKAALIFTGSSPILIITSYPSLEDKRFLEKLKQKGIDKFIAFEVQLEIAKEKYGNRFDLITDDLDATEDMRILDYNGQLAFERFSFDELGEMIKHDGHNM
ncbi:MAG: hypothetical protein ACYSTS_13575 [Planctomycetota bacterium]|jgi:hypothetical protein